MSHWILTRKRDSYRAAWTTRPMSQDKFLGSIKSICASYGFEFVLADYILEEVCSVG